MKSKLISFITIAFCFIHFIDAQGLQIKGGFSYSQVKSDEFEEFGKNIVSFQVYVGPDIKILDFLSIEPNIGYVGKAFKLKSSKSVNERYSYKGINYYLETPVFLNIKIPVDQYDDSYLVLSAGMYYSWAIQGKFTLIDNQTPDGIIEKNAKFRNHKEYIYPLEDLAENIYGYKFRATIDLSGFLLYFEFSRDLNDLRYGQVKDENNTVYQIYSGGIGFNFR